MQFQPTLINLHPNEYIQGLRYYPCAVNLDRCIGSCNTLNDLSDKVYVSNKTESKRFQHDCRNKWIENINKAYIMQRLNVNLMVANVIQIKSRIKINVSANVKILINIMLAKKIIFRILLHVVLKLLYSYYQPFSDYLWWNYRRNKNSFNKF